MRILIVASYKTQYSVHIAPFIEEQMESLTALDVEVDLFLINGHGVSGYLKCLSALKQKIEGFHPDIIHAHFGLSGLLAVFQRRVPVVVTFHGSDINNPKVRLLSKIAMYLAAYTIFVSQKNIALAHPRKHYALLPCGVNMEIFHPQEKSMARQQLGWNKDERYVLFAGAFDNLIKNAALAQAALTRLPHVHLVESKGYTREQMATLYNAADVLLMTSHTEGSPQVIKEAMACGCPIVSVDVGDVAERITGLDGCYIAERTANDVAAKLRQALAFGKRTAGRKQIIACKLDNKKIARQLIDIYNQILIDDQ